ncbi:hypothetical protein GF342_02880 [Candidatus Woesearchaeota archaeon]|nr:hypothetical protein [Candidatus Woesearchaeota archaeon]
MTKRRGAQEENLRAKISFPHLSIEFTSADSLGSLREINKMLNTLRAMDFALETSEMDDPLFFRFINLSDELRANREIMDFLRSVNKIEENFKQKKVSIENTKILDFSNNSYSTSVDTEVVAKKLGHLLKGVSNADYVVIHVIGSISSEEKQGIVDGIKNRLQRADVKTLFTDKELLGKTVIEGIFFGDFAEEL